MKRMAYRDKARSLLNGRMLLFSNAAGQSAREDRDGFKRLVEMAAEFGATHVHVGELPFRYDNWVLPDNSDPYAAWCNHSAGLLRVCPPPALHEWVSVDHAKCFQEYIRWQLDVMKPYGLKGESYAIEPMWLPEGVYRAHPNWRGAQCELGRIALRPYFAPNIDNPEVLELYRSAMREYAMLFPEVDHYRFLSNDSGAGIAWTPNVYPGVNGPTATRGRNGGERIANWLKALQEGAAAAGVNMRLNIHSSGFPPELTAASQTACAPGTFVRGGNASDDSYGGPGASLSGGVWTMPYPAVGLGSVPAFMEALQGIYNTPQKPCGLASIGLSGEQDEVARWCLEAFLDDPETGSVATARRLARVAARYCGSEKGAERLISVWRAVEQAGVVVRQVRQKGFGQVLAFCGVSMRWLTRPLVPQPEKLTADELRYVTPKLFTTELERDLSSFGYVLGKGVFSGESVIWMARWCLTDACGILQGAERQTRALAQEAQEPEARVRLELLADRIGVYACLVVNARHAIMYQYAIDTAGQPQYGPNPADYDDNMINDMRSFNMRKVARAELDNTYALIDLISHGRGKVIEHARDESEESVFMLERDICGALRHKAEVMLNHWHEYEALYPTCKVWDFEPPSRGNIVRE